MAMRTKGAAISRRRATIRGRSRLCYEGDLSREADSHTFLHIVSSWLSPLFRRLEEARIDTSGRRGMFEAASHLAAAFQQSGVSEAVRPRGECIGGSAP